MDKTLIYHWSISTSNTLNGRNGNYHGRTYGETDAPKKYANRLANFITSEVFVKVTSHSLYNREVSMTIELLRKNQCMYRIKIC